MADEKRVAIKIDTLDNIGDALRIHFGELKKEGTKNTHKGSTKVLRSPNALGLAQYYDTGESPEPELFDPDYYLVTTYGQPHIETIRIPNAASIHIKMSWKDASVIGTNYVGEDYHWIAPGLHSYPSELTGEYLPQFHHTYNRDPGKGGFNIGQWYCPVCGAESQIGSHFIDHDTRCIYDWKPDPLEGETWDDDIGTDDYLFDNMYYRGYNMPTIERTFNTNSFTLAYCTAEVAGGSEGYSGWGHYIELQAFREDGSLMTQYDYIIGEQPNTYFPYQMAPAIEKLNNYPNAEEVKF